MSGADRRWRNEPLLQRDLDDCWLRVTVSGQEDGCSRGDMGCDRERVSHSGRYVQVSLKEAAWCVAECWPNCFWWRQSSS